MENENKTFTDLDNIFDNFIKDGYVSDEREVIKGLRIKVKTLNSNELFKAEAEISERNPGIPQDITAKLRCAKILSYAIVTLNGNTILNDGATEEEKNDRRIALYIHLMKSPTILVQNAYDFYLETMQKEYNYYSIPNKISEEVENFSKAQGVE